MTSSINSITIETLVLVAIWNRPFIFQGCFQICGPQGQKKRRLFFRCECHKYSQSELTDQDFSPEDYDFTHLYNEAEAPQLANDSEAEEYALYLLKYALNSTLIQMITRSKQSFVSIDDEAMQSLVKRMEPFLCGELSFSQEEQDIGFAVAMDFHPAEDMGRSAVRALLGNDGNTDSAVSIIH